MEDKNLDEHWLRLWLLAWQHQAIAWTNVDLTSVRSCGIHLRTTLQQMLMMSILSMCLKITNLRVQLHLPGTNELRCEICGVWNFLHGIFKCYTLQNIRISVLMYTRIQQKRHWNLKVVIVTALLSLEVLRAVRLTALTTSSDNKVVKLTVTNISGDNKSINLTVFNNSSDNNAVKLTASTTPVTIRLSQSQLFDISEFYRIHDSCNFQATTMKSSRFCPISTTTYRDNYPNLLF